MWVRVSQMVAVSILLIHTHHYIAQSRKMWFVSSLTDCSRSLLGPRGQEHPHAMLRFLTWSLSGCVILDKVLNLSVLMFCYLEVGCMASLTQL